MKVPYTTIAALSLTCGAQAALTLTLEEESSDGSVNLTIEGTGQVGDGEAFVLSVGTADDSFLADGAPGATASPILMLGATAVDSVAYGDGNGGVGLDSFVEFAFSQFVPPVANSELSTMDGTYSLPGWRFSDFRLGSYILISATPPPIPVSIVINGAGLDIVTLDVVPEPSALMCLVLSGLGVFRRKR